MNVRHDNGFTLIELMITLFVAGIVLGIGIPAFTQLIATNRMAASANDLTSSLHLARTEAVKRRVNVTLCPSANWDAAAPDCSPGSSFENGWIVAVDCSNPAPPVGTCGAPNYSIDAFDTVLAVFGPMPEDIRDNFSTNAGAPQYVSYSATGFPRQIGLVTPPKNDFQLCDHRGNVDVGAGVAGGRWIRIGQTGRPQVYRMVAEVQGGPLGGC